MKHCKGKNSMVGSQDPAKSIKFYPTQTKNTRSGSQTSIDHFVDISLPNYEKPTHSTKPLGSVYGFAANTNQGINRNYNEDRVSIILNAA